MNVKKILGISLVVALAVTLAAMVLTHRKTEPTVALQQSQPATILTPPVSESTPPVKTPKAENGPPIQPVPVEVQPVKPAKKNLAQAAPAAAANGPVQDPLARAALSLVGADPNAEEYWLGAIFDPNLPDKEREDLMEDLNEDGLSDPQHPSAEDMQLIANRLPIIEEAATAAAQRGDTFALTHLWEAYKDLNNLLAGGPVP